MQTSILFKAPGHSSNRPIVILTGPAYGAQFSTPIGVRLSRALSSTAARMKCCCTLRRLLRAAFSEPATAAVAAAVIAAMTWHNVSIPEAVAAQEAVAADCLYAMPWAVVWALRASRMNVTEKGGES